MKTKQLSWLDIKPGTINRKKRGISKKMFAIKKIPPGFRDQEHAWPYLDKWLRWYLQRKRLKAAAIQHTIKIFGVYGEYSPRRKHSMASWATAARSAHMESSDS